VVLGLEFHVLDESLGIYDPEAEAWLKTSAERAEDAEERAEAAEERATQEADARHKAEVEVARLQEELERLKARL